MNADTPTRSNTATWLQRAFLTGILFTAFGAGAADFSGFWKENCSDPFGLQIQPHEGRYTVTFCGPGGCGTPDPRSATPIEGDGQYEVLGPDKLRVLYAQEYAPLYTKCTTEIHPVLEYSAADRAEGRRGFALTIAAHVAYLAAAVLMYLFVNRRTRGLMAIRRRAVRTGLAALMFSPGVFISWPFANPTFAFMGLLISVATVAQTPVRLFALQILYTLGPIGVVWACLFAVAHLRGGPGSRAA